VLTESAVESRFALANGFLGVRAARAVSRGPTWVSWLGYIKWASWPRCYVAGLYDRPNTEPPVPALVPVADWSRVRIVLNGEPQLLRAGEMLSGLRTLDLWRGLLLSELSYRTRAGIAITGNELRLVSQADRAVGLQLLRFSLDRDGIDVGLEASFGMAGLGMEPLLLEPDIGAWRTEGSDKVSRWREVRHCGPETRCWPRSVRSRCVGTGAGVPSLDRWSNSIGLCLWHALTVEKTIRFRRPARR
jgi:Glycosyl hydrolase family 65, N-terminal domain